jgi:hypothetical protein
MLYGLSVDEEMRFMKIFEEFMVGEHEEAVLLGKGGSKLAIYLEHIRELFDNRMVDRSKNIGHVNIDSTTSMDTQHTTSHEEPLPKMLASRGPSVKHTAPRQLTKNPKISSE